MTEENEIAERIAEKDLKPTPKAVEFEIATGEKSAQRIAQEHGHEIIKNAKTWEELHNGLKKTGLRFEKKGSGGIILVGDIAVKASSVDHSFSMGKLVKRLGEYQSGDYLQTSQEIKPEPLNQAITADVQAFSEATRELASWKNENSDREKQDARNCLQGKNRKGNKAGQYRKETSFFTWACPLFS